MSTTYSDLTSTAFPDTIDSFDRFIDPDASMYAAIKTYYAYIDNGDLISASAVLASNPQLQKAIVNANALNKLRDSIIAMERYYFSDIKTSIVNLVKYKGTYSANVVYAKYNVVMYNTPATGNQAYIAYVDTIPKGTLPTNTDYWVPVTLRGEQGASGTGLAPRGYYNASAIYYKDDLVVYNNALWACNNNNTTGQTPLNSSSYWWKVLEIDPTLLVYDNSVSRLDSTTLQGAIDEIAGKMLTSGNIGSYAAAPTHSHTKSQITDFPTSLPANGGNATTVNGHTVAKDVPADANFYNTTYGAGTGLQLSGTSFNVVYGTTANTACQGNDSRLSNARTPLSHTHTKSQITDFPSSLPANGGTATSAGSASNQTNFGSVLRNIQLSTDDLTAGSSTLATGSMYIVYE